MRINEKFERSGDFWLPSEPDRKVHGTLSISDGGHIELRLAGSLVSFYERVERIIGQIEGEGGVTLDDCLCTSSRFSQGVEELLIRVNLALTGIAYGEDDSPFISSLMFSVEGIDEWVGISGLKFDPQPEKGTATLLYQQPLDISFNLGNGMHLLIVFGYSWPVRIPLIREAKISQKTYFKLVSQNPRELIAFTRIAEKITTFLCFAIREIVCLDSMLASLDDLHQDTDDQKTRSIPVNVYYPSWPYSKNRPTVNGVKLFEFADICNDAKRIINNWINGDEEVGSAFNLYFWTQIREAQYLDGKFLALAQGLEALHQRISTEKKI